MQALLKKYGDPHKTTSDGTPHLHLATKYSGCDMIQSLLERGAAIDQPSANGKTPLCYAIGTYPNAKYLLEKGANPNLKDADGNTPLHRAARNGSQQVVKLLFAHKADPHCANTEGRTPLHCAIDGAWHDLVHLLIQDDETFNESSDVQDLINIANGHSYQSIATLLRDKRDGLLPTNKQAELGEQLLEATAKDAVTMASRLIEAGAPPLLQIKRTLLTPPARRGTGLFRDG